MNDSIFDRTARRILEDGGGTARRPVRTAEDLKRLVDDVDVEVCMEELDHEGWIVVLWWSKGDQQAPWCWGPFPHHDEAMKERDHQEEFARTHSAREVLEGLGEPVVKVIPMYPAERESSHGNA